MFSFIPKTLLATFISLLLSSYAVASGASFDNDKFLEACGGDFIQECDSEALNQWTIFSEALELAKKENKALLIDFGANWCPACRAFKAKWQSETAIRQKVEESYIMVEINGDEILNQKYFQQVLAATGAEVKYFPTLVAYEPKFGGYILFQTFVPKGNLSFLLKELKL